MSVRISKNRVALENIPLNLATGANIASASTINLTTATGNTVHITGSTAITAVTLGAGMVRDVIFDGSLTLTHHATNNNLPGGANITTASNDRARYISDGTTVYCVNYQKADGTAVVLSQKIIQVITEAYTGGSVTSSSTTKVDTGLTANITPTATTSKILAIVHHGYSYKTGGDCGIGVYLLRGSTEISSTTSLPTSNTTDLYVAGPILVYADSPAVTSSLTYKTQINRGAGGAGTVGIVSNPSLPHTITLMEIAAS